MCHDGNHQQSAREDPQDARVTLGATSFRGHSPGTWEPVRGLLWRTITVPSLVLEHRKVPASESGFGLGAIPVVDVTETDKAYQITSEVPVGMGEKNVEVKFAEGVLTIKGEKQEEREEKKKGYSTRESSFGSFERTFQVPGDVDTDKIKASFKKGMLAVTLPKSAEARRAEKRITVKTD